MTEAKRLGDVVRDAAQRLGLARVGATPVEPPKRFDLYRSWLAAGHHGEMAYLASPEHLAARADLTQLLRGARTVIVAALAYDPRAQATGANRGAIARYARGDDYHMVLRDRLVALADAIAAAAGRPVATRPCVDSAPVLERELAERAGLGFAGKNTVLIIPGLGSYLVLGELLLDVEVDLGDGASYGTRCGTCRACLDACPTQAFVDAHTLDARRCISYLTIESDGAIPVELRRPTGAWVFGCDVCQEVCPYNRSATSLSGLPTPSSRVPPRLGPEREVTGLRARDDHHAAPDLLALATAPSNQLRHFVRRTALRRLDRARLLRNVCVALGNTGDAAAVPALAARLADTSPLVRRHAAWALGAVAARHPDAAPAALAALEKAAVTESDPQVLSEISAASSRTPPPPGSAPP